MSDIQQPKSPNSNAYQKTLPVYDSVYENIGQLDHSNESNSVLNTDSAAHPTHCPEPTYNVRIIPPKRTPKPLITPISLSPIAGGPLRLQRNRRTLNVPAVPRIISWLTSKVVMKQRVVWLDIFHQTKPPNAAVSHFLHSVSLAWYTDFDGSASQEVLWADQILG